MNVPAYAKNEKAITWIKEIAALTKPDNVYWCDGSQSEYDEMCQRLVKSERS
jgi:Phosphoenolpyruvate carboxykinase (GTP)